MNRRAYGVLVSGMIVAFLVFSAPLSVFAAAGRDRRPAGSRSLGSGADEQEKDVRARRVGGGFALERELATDRSVETWLYVFSALMLLCIGWLCFKPARVYTGKKPRRVVPKKGDSAKKKPKT